MKSKQKSLTEVFLKNSIYGVMGGLASKIGGLIFTIVIARYFIPETFGLYNLALSIIITLTIFTDLGISTTSIRYISEALTKKREETSSRFLFFLKYRTIIAIVLSLMLFLLSETISQTVFNKPELIIPLKIGAMLLFILTLQSIFVSLFYALKEIKYAATGDAVLQIVKIGLILITFRFYQTIESIFIISIIASLVATALLYLITIKKYGFILKKGKEITQTNKKRILNFLGWISIASVSTVLFINIDTFMLGMFVPAEFIGYYKIIFTVVGAIAGLIATTGSILLPIFTQVKRERLKIAFKKVFKYSSMITIPATFGLMTVIIPTIKLVFGAKYVPPEYQMIITITAILLSILMIETVIVNIYTALLDAKEFQKYVAILTIFGIAINIILNYILIKSFISISFILTIFGVGLATIISRYLNLFILAYIARKKIKVKIDMRNLVKTFIASAVMLIFTIAYKHFIALTIASGLIMIILAIIIYLIVMFIIKGLTREDLTLIKYLKLD